MKKSVSAVDLATLIHDLLVRVLESSSRRRWLGLVGPSFMRNIGIKKPSPWQVAETGTALLFKGWIAIGSAYDDEKANQVLEGLVWYFASLSVRLKLDPQELGELVKVRFDEYAECLNKNDPGQKLYKEAQLFVENVTGRRTSDIVEVSEAMTFLHAFNQSVRSLVEQFRVS